MVNNNALPYIIQYGKLPYYKNYHIVSNMVNIRSYHMDLNMVKIYKVTIYR